MREGERVLVRLHRKQATPGRGRQSAFSAARAAPAADPPRFCRSRDHNNGRQRRGVRSFASLYWRSESARASEPAAAAASERERKRVCVQACRLEGSRGRKVADADRAAPPFLSFSLLHGPLPCLLPLSQSLACSLQTCIHPFLRQQEWMEGTTQGVMTDCYCGDYDCAAAAFDK